MRCQFFSGGFIALKSWYFARFPVNFWIFLPQITFFRFLQGFLKAKIVLKWKRRLSTIKKCYHRRPFNCLARNIWFFQLRLIVLDRIFRDLQLETLNCNKIIGPFPPNTLKKEFFKQNIPSLLISMRFSTKNSNNRN